MNARVVLICLISAVLSNPGFVPGAEAQIQTRRPIPYPVIPDTDFQAAVAKGTRTLTGEPGPNYWMNAARYDIKASLSPSTKTIRGTAKAVYINNSPDALDRVAVHLHQNLHKEGVVRNRPQKLTGGVHVARVAAGGEELIEVGGGRGRPAPGYRIDGTVMWITLPESIPAGGTQEFEFAWEFIVPDVGAPRNGTDGEVFFMAYWYPQFAVYDDVNGWKADQYFGNGEFYADFSEYTVELTVPQGFLVGATGILQNAGEVLSEQTIARMEASRANPEYIVRVVDEEDLGKATRESALGTHTWVFKARDVRDFAWGTSDKYLWDMTIAEVGAEIHAFWRADQTAWARSAEFGKYTIDWLSDRFFPYPYPHMTAMEGIIGGGMEFPMVTLIGGSRSDRSLFGTTFHEIAHMYFPMIVAQDEKDDTWMDEGLTSFNTAEGSAPFWDENTWLPARQGYYRIAGTPDEIESRRHADTYPYGTAARGTAAYNKPAVSLHALRGLLGDDLFYEAYTEYARRWAFKHPEPYDLFNAFNDVVQANASPGLKAELGPDLDWFWTTQFFETWTLDQAIGSVVWSDQGVTVVVEDRGLSPYPVLLKATYADGAVREQTLSVLPWLEGHRQQTALFPMGDLVRVEIDAGLYLPDVDRSNNIWTK